MDQITKGFRKRHELCNYLKNHGLSMCISTMKESQAHPTVSETQKRFDVRGFEVHPDVAKRKSTFLLNQPVFQSETVKLLLHYARFQDTHKTIKLTRVVPFMESSGMAPVASEIGQILPSISSVAYATIPILPRNFKRPKNKGLQNQLLTIIKGFLTLGLCMKVRVQRSKEI